MSETVPRHIGIILDGNRRWAKERGLPSFEGHSRGFENVESILLAARDFGIRHMVVYAFSTENWKRSKKEVAHLMKIFEALANKQLWRRHTDRVAVRFVGQRERLSKRLQAAMRRAEVESPINPRITLWWCISYGGRADVVQAAQKVAQKKEKMTEGSISKHVWTSGMPDPDLIIRPGGEMRLSNFLLWQIAYSELFFTKTYWPAFTVRDLQKVLKEYAVRERRMGK